ncbi:MAG: TldD/PmbA family protein [Candidatus Hydrogenedentota bacterium]|nr:MAG: TldD/PmbA family protein [Candidatus Hydrogenedentota bacterium]
MIARKSDENMVTFAVEAALAAGATAAEGFLIRSSSTTVEVSEGKVENVKVRDGSGIGARVLAGERLGFAHTSDLSDSGIERAARDAVTNAESGFPDPYNQLPAPAGEYPEIERFDPELADVGLEERIELAMLMEASARSYDKRIAKVRQSTVSDSSSDVHLANSRGISLWNKGTFCSASLLAVAEEDGEAQMGWDFGHSLYFRALRVEPIGKNAARRAVDLLGAKQVETTTVPVILDSPVASEFLAAVGHALMADQVQKHKSLFAGKIGEKVASTSVTIVDDGAFERGIAPSPADGEGVVSQRTVLIESGILRRFLHNTYTAGKDAVESTGNGVRFSYAALPEVGASNFYLVPGKVTRAELVEGCSRGYLVTDVMGMHTVDMVSGDFSVGASGLWIESGKAKFPVRETTIAGNVKDILVEIEAVADDLGFYSRYGSPTILIGNVVVSGK